MFGFPISQRGVENRALLQVNENSGTALGN